MSLLYDKKNGTTSEKRRLKHSRFLTLEDEAAAAMLDFLLFVLLFSTDVESTVIFLLKAVLPD